MFVYRVGAMAVLLCVGLAWPPLASAQETSPAISERQTVGVVVGGMLPVRFMDGQLSKLNGVSVHPYWQIVVMSPTSHEWWSGSVALGVEAAVLGITEPTGAYGIGVTPKLIYTLASFGQLKPYVEGGGGPLWTNFDGRIPEQGSDFNFLLWGSAGATYDLTARWALNAGVRFSHISNGGTGSPNGGVNYVLPFIGIAAKLF
ncbi:MAG: acyloxyacyl hydrolase [Nitrospira sp.]|nr:acyloxyacyl hydrolase [Nitrospira sp.]